MYDGTNFLDKHPGGAQSITIVAGDDATEDFLAIHSSDAKKQLADFHIGTLVGGQAIEDGDESPIPGSASFLTAKRWKKVVLTSVTDVSKDAKVYRFALDHVKQNLGLPIGQHVYVRLRRKVGHKEAEEVVAGELVQRAYTPVSKQDDRGFIDLLIKCGFHGVFIN